MARRAGASDMRRLVPVVLRPWTLPLIVLALVVPGVAAFAAGGPQIGLAIGALTVAALVVIAARTSFEEEIEVAGSEVGRYGLLVVIGAALDDPAAVERVREIAEQGASVARAEPRLRVLAPVRPSPADRWASDLSSAREAAQRDLAISLAALAAAGLDATGSVGDADLVQAVEDELRTFGAREVLLAAHAGADPGRVEQIRRRLDRPLRVVDQ